MLEKLLLLFDRSEEAELQRLIGFFANMAAKLSAYQDKLIAKMAEREAKIDELQGELENLGDLAEKAQKAADNIKKIVQ